MAQTRAQLARPAAKGKYQRQSRDNLRRYPPSGMEWGEKNWAGTGLDPRPATGAVAGIPGSWTPAGNVVPASQAAVIAGTPVPIVASPQTPWTSGQYVQTLTAGASGRVTWTGTAWVGGAAPLFSVVGQTVAAVQAYVGGLGDLTDPAVQAEIQRLLDEERANDNRTTLVTWLDQQTGVV